VNKAQQIPRCARNDKLVNISKSNAMKNPDQTLDEILNLSAAHFKVPREKLSPDDDFFKTLRIDSLQALDLLTRLENHFGVELPDYELQGVSDFRTLASRIQSRL
jgi:acyl carrier protein